MKNKRIFDQQLENKIQIWVKVNERLIEERQWLELQPAYATVKKHLLKKNKK